MTGRAHRLKRLSERVCQAFHWVPINERLPDSDTTVLVAVVDADEPVWLGYLDGSEWCEISGAPIRVTHWAELPAPPPSSRSEK